MMYWHGDAIVNVDAESEKLAVENHKIEINEIKRSLQAIKLESK